VIAPDGQPTEEQLLAQGPSVVIIDMGAVQPESALPDRLLIGIHPESHALLLTGQAAHLITLDQLTQILTRQNNRDLHKEGGMNQRI
jgi:hypothetical protein